jgi:urease accessory protein UreH
VLTRAYAEPPFRIGRCFDNGRTTSMIIVCAAPGVFPGDDLRQSVHVEAGARAMIRSQSALQLHAGNGPSACISAQYQVDEEGELRCYWDPLIPFPASRLTQRIDVRLTRGSRFSWSDAMMSGRCARGESWTLTALDHELRCSVAGSLRYLERYRLAPGERRVTAPWMAGGASYLGTILLHDSDAPADAAEALQRRFVARGAPSKPVASHQPLVRSPQTPASARERPAPSPQNDVRVAFDRIDHGLIVGRLLGWSGPAFAAARLAAQALAESDR